MTAKVNPAIADVILDSLNDGVYVCDRDRRILYWNRAAERITGWSPEDVVGLRCMDNILDHKDKDGRRLCGEEFCPLHRCMCTDRGSSYPLIVFGRKKCGERVALAVSVAPIHDAEGRVMGGVETFRDFTETYSDLMHAKQIQTLSMTEELPKDERVKFASFYLPHDMIGGDYVAVQRLDRNHYGFFLADVMGHGVAAALYTMHLSSLWNRHCQALMRPAEFARLLNRDLCRIVKDESFATAICGVLHASLRTVRIATAGGPPLVLIRSNGQIDEVVAPGWPFGMSDEAEYDEQELKCAAGDCLLMFTDGAIEVRDAAGQMLGTEGLLGILYSLGYPEAEINIEILQKALLVYSNEIRLEDDMTLLEVRFA